MGNAGGPGIAVDGELARDAGYARSDVQHSFETYFGEAIDCVDYYAQPGVKALEARGHAVPKLPPMTREARAIEQLPDFMFNGKPDRLGRSRSCPEATVPVLRVTAQDVLSSGGVEARRSMMGRKVPVPRSGTAPPPPAITDGHEHVTQIFTHAPNAVLTSTVSTTSIYAPAVSNTQNLFSLSQTWTEFGHGYTSGPGTCTPADCIETVEAGWHVAPLFYPSAPTAPHLFTWATADGYGTGCYNNDATAGTCLPFVATPMAPLIPGVALPASALGSTPFELRIQMTHSVASGWCLSAGVVPNVGQIVCWPNSDFSAAGMGTGASEFLVGGEVYSFDYTVPMGSGRAPGHGYKQAAYHRDYAVSGSFTFKPGVYLDKWSYGMAKPGAGGAWTNWFYFGSEPLIGWAASQALD